MTIHKTTAVTAGLMPDFAQAGVVLCRSGSFVTADDSVVSGDTIQMVPVPKNAMILGVDVYYSTLPAGVTGCDVGYGTDPDRFMATIPFTGDNMQSWPASTYRNKAAGVDSMWMVMTADDTIDIAITKAPTKIPTGQAMYMHVQYKMVGTINDES